MSESLKLDAGESIKNLPLLLKDTDYKLTQFKQSQIDAFEERIFTKAGKGKPVLYTQCFVRKKEIKLTPEEAVRQLYIMVLNEDLGYPFDRMEVEAEVTFGREKNGRILLSPTLLRRKTLILSSS